MFQFVSRLLCELNSSTITFYYLIAVRYADKFKSLLVKAEYYSSPGNRRVLRPGVVKDLIDLRAKK